MIYLGFVHILCNNFPELTDGILRPEVATVGCCRRQQHLWGHRNLYSRPEAATVPCTRRAQDSISHWWLRNMWMSSKVTIRPGGLFYTFIFAMVIKRRSLFLSSHWCSHRQQAFHGRIRKVEVLQRVKLVAYHKIKEQIRVYSGTPMILLYFLNKKKSCW